MTFVSVALPCFSRVSIASCATQLTVQRKSAMSPTARGASRWTKGFGAFGCSGYRWDEQFTPARLGGQRRVEKSDETGPKSSGPVGDASTVAGVRAPTRARRDASNATAAARYISRGIVRLCLARREL